MWSLHTIVQIAVLLILCAVLLDSHNRTQQHKNQMRLYDEERSHILEQMMWIDKAAKKVHKNYAQKESMLNALTKNMDNNNSNGLGGGNEDDEAERAQMRKDLEKMRIRIQMNARDRIQHQFGDRPVQVSLGLDDGRGGTGTGNGATEQQHLVLALSDDTPHAVSTFLEQVNKKLWDDIEIEATEDNGKIIQISTRSVVTMPTLEFVEKSRACHQAGSVSLLQLESDDLRLLVLRIRLQNGIAMAKDEVCVGNVVQGLSKLEEFLSLHKQHQRHRQQQLLREQQPLQYKYQPQDSAPPLS